jgi:hypothetical protein
MIYAVLPKKFPVRIGRELKLKHDGFWAFGRAKSGVFKARPRKIPCIFPANRENPTLEETGSLLTAPSASLPIRDILFPLLISGPKPADCGHS